MDNDVTPAVPGAPYDLVVETGGDQFPVAGASPELSWKLPSDVSRQIGFDLRATVGDERWEFNGHGAVHRFVAWPWRELRSSERVSWSVRVHHDGSTSAWSEPAAFEAGLFEADWTGEWITATVADAPVGSRPAHDFTTTFTLAEVPSEARLYSAALGVYELFVNGQRIGGAELAPGSTSYDRTLYAQAADPASALVPGLNTLRLRVSDGWFRGRTDAFRKEALWGPRVAVRAELRVLGPEGPRTAAATDGAWQVAESEIVTADLMDGEVADLRRDAVPLGSAIVGGEAPPVSWSPAPPVRVVEELSPASITRIGPDDLVVDFGQNVSGRVRLSELGEDGARTTLTFGEHIGPDGQVTLTHLDTPSPDGSVVPFVQRDEVISDGKSRSFEPHHTVHGFQYVQIHRDGIELTERDVISQVLHTDLRSVGTFSSSDEDLNRLWDVARWSFRGNAVDVPTDCPTRERAGWTGDWQIFLSTAVQLFDVDGFSRKWLQSVRDDQLDDGRIVNISPDPSRMRVFPNPAVDFATGSAGWGDAVILVPWELYRTYGDVRVLRDSWDAMTRWVSFALNAAADHRHPSRVERSPEPLPHEQYIWDGTFHFGEWCEPTPIAEDGTPGPAMPDPMAWAMSDKGEVGTAYLYRSVSTLAAIAGVLGDATAAAQYRDIADKVRDAWRQEFIDDDGRTPNNTQASYVRALSTGLAPEPLRERAAQHLVALIEEADGHLGTGFLSTADLLPTLADTGHADVAEQLLWQRSTPSWLGMLDRGATTIWEEWEGVDRNGNAHASLNHYSKGAVIRYLHSHILGLQQDDESVAWTSFTVAPVVPARLNWARGHFDSPQGLIEVDWQVDSDDAVLRVQVPGGATATIIWGDQQQQVGPGHHELHTRTLTSAHVPA
ncbi:family 78 glycoside hydrolase catalytic domain [Microbacterium sp. NPDC056044]|uniref:family 78 glycoside hydrolase catalytic domain n=1 Tax=Microbacterium sp. NPDC056044 TaxID=3345690 RepID=UPI0035E0ACD1